MTYSVNDLAQLSGISVRTIHYYDEIGLLKPSSVRPNGYRTYAQREVMKLQQILFFRELEIPLREIARIMGSPGFDRRTALADQRRLLALKRDRLDRLLETIDRELGGEGRHMGDNTDLFASFGDTELTKHMEEAKRRWGNTDAWRQSMERTRHWTKADYERIRAQGEELTRQLAETMAYPPEDDRVQALIARHYAGIRSFYDVSADMYRNLGAMYVDDPRFAAYYEKFRPGLSVFMRDAIAVFCAKRSA